MRDGRRSKEAVVGCRMPVTAEGEGPPVPRRRLLGQGLGWLILAVMAYPLFRFLEFRLPKKPVRVRVEKDIGLRGFILEHDFILFRGQQEQVWAVSRRCTHLGCTLSYDEAAKRLVCPCHNSQFDTSGKRLAGPAKRDLRTFAVAKAPAGGKGYTVTL